MENATGELRKASDYQKLSRNRMCCILLCLAIFALILTLAVVL